VIVGASLAGLRAAQTLRARGFDGQLTVVGDELHMPYDRPPLSKQLLAGRVRPADCALRLDDLEAEWVLGRRAIGLDLERRTVVCAGPVEYGFDGLILATGSSARPWRGVSLPARRNVFFLRTLDDSLALVDAIRTARKVVILGAGFIGCETASTLRGIGCNVELVDVAPYPMSPLGADVGAVCTELHAEHGVGLHLGVSVQAFEAHDDRIAGVRLTDGSQLPADLLLVAIGAEPNTRWLHGSGLTLDPGIVCDETCEAKGGPDVFCAGDVASFPSSFANGELVRVEHWTNAVEQALVAAGNLLALPDKRVAYDPVPSFWSDQYGIKIQSVGFPARADKHVLLEGDLADRKFVMGFISDGMLVGAVGFASPRRMLWFRRQIAERAMVEQVALQN
jgi:3-phenylpropionate/trans-cinnamate dioxygenase ferredoxin reductase component